MDPLTASLLLIALLGTTTKVAGAAVTDIVAKAKGETPPSLEKWRLRHQAKLARGEKSHPTPRYTRRLWDNATEARTAKAAQRHEARMQIIREGGPEAVARHKQRMRKRAARRAQVSATLAKWGNVSWDQAKRSARDTREVIAERRADRAARKDSSAAPVEDTPLAGDQTTDQTAGQVTGQGEVAAAEGTSSGESPGPQGGAGTEEPTAKVIPLRRDTPGSEQEQPDPAADPPTTANEPSGAPEPQEDTTPDPAPGEHPVSDSEPAPPADGPGTERTDTPQSASASSSTEAASRSTDQGSTIVTTQHSGEITDLSTALVYSRDTQAYCGLIVGTFEAACAQAQATSQAFNAELGKLETAQATLTEKGFNGRIIGHLAATGESFAALSGEMSRIAEQLSALHDSLAEAQSGLAAAERAFTEQLGIQEQVQSQKANGVARDTDFYANA
ncbi:hypothetical protein [Saccharopolyspora cebuensis]|uniref:hypothetical protein n=1 Tax=Saccharopolyspora cebuensis TaxID=418759 RepID=UPI0031E6AFFF